MGDTGWFEGAKKTFCINDTLGENVACGGIIDLPRALGKDEPFISTNREERDKHDAAGWIECPEKCGFALWLKP